MTEILLTGLALSADAMAVAISAGMAADPARRWRQGLMIAGTFGGFQALMPCLGWLAAAAFKEHVANWGPWIAGGLLIGIGVKMGWEGIQQWKGSADGGAPRNWFTPGALFGLGLATSIDAAAVGISLALTGAPLLSSAAIIGLITFICCLPAFLLGCRLARLGGHRAPVFGGLVLIGLGVRCILTR